MNSSLLDSSRVRHLNRQLPRRALLVSLLISGSVANANTIAVDTNLPDVALGDGNCSLIEAINEAQSPGSSAGDCAEGSSGLDTIILEAAGPYTLTSVNNDMDGPNGLPSITTAIAIDGQDEIVERGFPIGEPPLFRIFHVASTGSLRLDRLTVQNGSTQQTFEPEPVYEGGGIYNKGELNLSGCTLSNNVGNTALGVGGALYNAEGATALIVASVIERNSPDAIANLGVIDIVRSSVRFNDGDGAGAILNGNEMRISASLIHGNQQLASSGGITNSGTLKVINTTVTENSDISGRGGIWGFNESFAEIINSTVADNTSVIETSITQLFGPMTLRNTVVYSRDVNASDATDSLCSGDVMSMGHNIANDDSCNLTEPTDHPNTDPMLGELADNGGPTMTRALLPGSPAIDAGEVDCADADGALLLTDQRGMPRPVDGNADGIVACDVGAYEVQPAITTIDLDIKPGNTKNPVNPRSKGTLKVAILTNENFDADTVDVDTVQFGPGAAQPVKYRLDDVDDDGDWDLVLKFKTPDSGITCSDTEATLTAQTLDGTDIAGADSVKTVGCKPKKDHDRRHDKHGKHNKKDKDDKQR